jgi:hypothetical protein
MQSEDRTAMAIMYEIRLKGHLDERQEEWLQGFSMMLHPNGETILTGRVTDQAALYGLLLRIRDLGIPLLSVNSNSDRQEVAEA